MIGILLTILLAFILGILVLIKFIFGNQSHWNNVGVYTIPNSIIGTTKERLTAQIPIQIADKRGYDHAVKIHKKKYAGTIMFRHGSLFIYDLELIKSITIKDFDHFTDRKIFNFPKNDRLINQMLINQDGQDWKDLRTTMSPTFTTGKIRRMFNIFNESSLKMVEFLKQELTSGPRIELRDVCGRFTMDVIASSAFGVDSLNFKDKNSVFATKGKKFQDNLKPIIILKILLFILFPKLYEILGLHFFDVECTDFFEEILTASIKHRQETGEKRDDFLQLMLEAQAGQLTTDDNTGIDEDSPTTTTGVPNGKKITVTNELILAQCTLFFLAGFDVMETLLMFTAYELALNPDIQERLYEEISSAVKQKGGKISYDLVNNLEYLDLVISETLRKYPGAVRGERKCTIDYKVPGTDFTIKKGTHIIIPIFGIHYDEKYYPEPERFDPERFTAENKASLHAAAYMPFGLGQRNCIARRFALIEGKTAIANLVLNFVFEPCENTLIPMKYSPRGFIKPLDGMWLNLHLRKTLE